MSEKNGLENSTSIYRHLAKVGVSIGMFFYVQANLKGNIIGDEHTSFHKRALNIALYSIFFTLYWLYR